ncbi:fad nad-binding oxidoreductase family protein [Nannochloropsis oceanica]
MRTPYLSFLLVAVLFAATTVTITARTTAAFTTSRIMPRTGTGGAAGKALNACLQLKQKHSRTPTVGMSAAASPNGRVAVIGAGISGLACSRELKAQGMDVLLFDTGRLAPGGRCSSKTVVIDGGKTNVLFDHSAQFLSAPISPSPPSSPSATWDKWVREMEAQGILREWDSKSIGILERGGKFIPRASTTTPPQPRALVSPQGMRAIPTYLAQGLHIDRPKWVSKAKWIPQTDGTGGFWDLWHYQEQLDAFEYLVIAHNGKCAARLAKSAGEALAPVARLLETKFGASIRGGNTPRYMQLCSLFVLMVVLDEPVSLPGRERFEGAFVEGVSELSWVAEQGGKMGQDLGGGTEGGRAAWVLVSSPGFAEQHKVPQENIPEDKAAEVTRLMLRAFRQALGMQEKGEEGAETSPLVPAASVLQLWGAGNPISVADMPQEAPFVFQAATGCGVCGDWLLAPSIPAAATSGIALARHIARHHAAKINGDRKVLEEDVGLRCGFKAVQGARPIASFPGDKAPVVEAVSPKPGRGEGGGGRGGGGGGRGRGGGGGGGGRGGGGNHSGGRGGGGGKPKKHQQPQQPKKKTNM